MLEVFIVKYIQNHFKVFLHILQNGIKNNKTIDIFDNSYIM